MIMVRIVCQSLTFIAQPVVKAWGHEGVSWGCFKDFEEHLITVYEIVQYHHRSAINWLFTDGCTRKADLDEPSGEVCYVMQMVICRF